MTETINLLSFLTLYKSEDPESAFQVPIYQKISPYVYQQVAKVLRTVNEEALRSMSFYPTYVELQGLADENERKEKLKNPGIKEIYLQELSRIQEDEENRNFITTMKLAQVMINNKDLPDEYYNLVTSDISSDFWNKYQDYLHIKQIVDYFRKLCRI